MCGVDEVRAKYERLRRVMDERVTRLWAAAEAEAFGYGGVAAVRHATGISSHGFAQVFETSPSKPRIRRPRHRAPRESAVWERVGRP